MWKDIVRGILKNAATAYGTRVLVERAVPQAEKAVGKVAKKLKTMSEKKTVAEDQESLNQLVDATNAHFAVAQTSTTVQPARIMEEPDTDSVEKA